MVGEKRAIVEVLFRPRRYRIGLCELLVLGEGVGLGEGEAAKNSQMQPLGFEPLDGERPSPNFDLRRPDTRA
jgi:hypothetical protein